MSSIGIFYGSCGGTTKIVADELAKAFSVSSSDVIDIEDDFDDVEQFLGYDILFLGSSTWGQGDVQHGWVDPLFEIENDAVDFSSKTVALFGAGDSKKHGEHFVSALGKMYKTFTKAGARCIGFVDAKSYSFDDSLALIDGQFCGLPIDEVNEKEKTHPRIEAWIEKLKKEI